MITADLYRPPDMAIWTGRTDGSEAEVQRWHQRIQPVSLLAGRLPELPSGRKGIALLGFVCDEGVRRNKGRPGAAEGPSALRKACGGFPVHFNDQLLLVDAGDVVCAANELEQAQETLSAAVSAVLSAGYFPLLMGGGHEITYGHARGIYTFLQQQQPPRQLGLLNVDAHFDLRIPGPEGASSGTGFWQLAQDCSRASIPFHYLALGIQQHSNTARLFRIANELKANFVPADAFQEQDKARLNTAIQDLLQQTDHLYLTIDMDVFAAPFAPGVSAPAYNGILPGSLFLECLRSVLRSGKVAGMDIAELNPSMDIDNRTARLGASLIFEAVAAIANG